MSLTYEQRVKNGLDVLAAALGAFIDQRMTTKTPMGAHWRDAYPDANLDGDVSAQVGVMLDYWDTVFRDLKQMGRTLVFEIKEWRNLWAHNKIPSDKDADRALDTMQRLMTKIGAKEAIDVGATQGHPVRSDPILEAKDGNPRIGGVEMPIQTVELLVVEFINDDAGYLAWLRANRSRYVINTPRSPVFESSRLHRANCRTISEGDKPWTTNQYKKICGPSKDSLDEWARKAIGQEIRRCGTCQP